MKDYLVLDEIVNNLLVDESQTVINKTRFIFTQFFQQLILFLAQSFEDVLLITTTGVNLEIIELIKFCLKVFQIGT